MSTGQTSLLCLHLQLQIGTAFRPDSGSHITVTALWKIHRIPGKTSRLTSCVHTTKCVAKYQEQIISRPSLKHEESGGAKDKGTQDLNAVAVAHTSVCRLKSTTYAVISTGCCTFSARDDVHRDVEDLGDLQDGVNVASHSGRHMVGGTRLGPAVAELPGPAGEPGAHVGVAKGEDGSGCRYVLWVNLPQPFTRRAPMW